MKNRNKAIILLLALVFAFVSGALVFSDSNSIKLRAYFSAFGFSDEFEKGLKPVSTLYFDNLNETEKQAYIEIVNNVSSHPEYIKIPKLTSSEFNNVYYAVKNDNPDILCLSESCNMITFLSTQFLQINYRYDVDSCSKMHDELMNCVDEILDSVPDSTQYEKEKFIHDYIVQNCSYEETENSDNAYGCIVEKKAVCSGYSRAVMLLLNKCDLRTGIVTGMGISPTQGQISHMWNVVWIDGLPYHLDVTWDDPASGESGAISYLYFNLNGTEIQIDHKDISLGEDFSATEHNYFKQNNMMFDSYDKNALTLIEQKTVENIKNGIFNVEFQFSNNEAYDNAVEDIINNNSYASDMYKIIEYLTENVGESLDYSHLNFSKIDSKRYIKIIFDEA